MATINDYHQFLSRLGFSEPAKVSVSDTSKHISALYKRITSTQSASRISLDISELTQCKVVSAHILYHRIKHNASEFKQVAATFALLPPEAIAEIIRDITGFAAECGNDLTEFARLFPLKQMEENWKKLCPQAESLDSTLKNYASELGQISKPLAVFQSTFNLQCRKAYIRVRNFIENVVAIMEYAFIPDQSSPPENSWHASFLVPLLLNLLLMPLTIGGYLSSYITEFWMLCTATTGVTLALIIVAALWYGYFRPCPNQIGAGFRNLTDEAYQGLLPIGVGRAAEVEELITCLSTSEENNLHPMIRAEAGCGKTTLIYQLAKRIALGDVPEQLKKVKLFYCNAATFCSTDALDTPEQRLKRVLKRIHGYENEVILVFDEAHNLGSSAFGSDSIDSVNTSHVTSPSMLETLKSYLDKGPQAIRFIGLTTSKEFQEKIEPNDAFVRRLRLMEIQPFIDDIPGTELQEGQEPRSEARDAHMQMIRRSAPNIHFSKRAITKIIQMTNENRSLRSAQPGRSSPVVEEVISKFKLAHSSESEKLKSLKTRLRNMESEFLTSAELRLVTRRGQEAMQVRRELRAEIEEISKQENIVQSEFQKLQRIMNLKRDLKSEIPSIAAKAEKNDALKKAYLFYEQFAHFLKDVIAQQRDQLTEKCQKRVTGKIDEAFVDECLSHHSN